MASKDVQESLRRLGEIGCLQVDDSIKEAASGLPVEIDLTQIFRHPSAISLIKDLYWSLIKDYQFDMLCGVPFCGLAISYILAYSYEFPFVIKREKFKSYGTKKLIDGLFEKGEKVIIIEDVVRTGQSVLNTAEALRQVGLIVEHAVALVDCDREAKESLAKSNIKLTSLIKIDNLVDILKKTHANGDSPEKSVTSACVQKPQADSVDLIEKLFEIGSVKIENITLKSGLVSPIYVDMRLVSRYPKLLKPIAELYWEALKDLDFDLICGVPFGALAFAVILAYEHNVPFIIERNKARSSGDAVLIDGKYKAGEKAVLIEDVVTSGKSLLETAEVLRENNLIVNDALAFLDRSQGGVENLSEYGINLKSVYCIKDVLKKIEMKDKEVSDRLFEWFQNNYERIDA